MKNSVHDNGGFIGRVADYAAEDYYTTLQVSGYNLNSASYDNISFTIGTNNTADIYFKPDGTTFFVSDTNGTIRKYSMATPWDLSSSSYANSSLSASSAFGLYFKTDGTRLYYISNSIDKIIQVDLSTAWDLSTAGTEVQGAPAVGSIVRGVRFSSDGTKMYSSDRANTQIEQFNLSTAWDISSSSASSTPSQTFNVGSQTTQPAVCEFNPSGTKMWVTDSGNDSIYEYSLSTAWSVSSASYSSISFDLSSEMTTPIGGQFKPDGTKMYIAGATNKKVYQYSVSASTTITGVYYDLSNATYDNVSSSAITQDAALQDLSFSSDGTKMYICGRNNDTVYQYTLSTAWNVSTALYANKSYYIGGQEGSLSDIFFKADGSKFYIIGYVSDQVHQYSLSTAWDISTASYDNLEFSVSSQENNPRGLTFKPDGTKMFVIGQTADAIQEYALSTAWNVSSASHTSTFSTSSQLTNNQALFFAPDGYKVWATGADDVIYQYILTTAWDISTASYDSVSFSVLSQSTQTLGIEFSTDGTKLYALDNTLNIVHQYSTGYNKNKKNSGVWSMDTHYLNTEATPQGYRYIKWHITDINSMSASMTQISELYLQNNGSTITWGNATITNPGGSNPVSESPPSLIDGAINTKVLDFNVDQGGGSIFIIDAGVGNIFIFDSYYYVTGNDTPDRDPISWTIEGSNDGTNYTVLHTVSNATITSSRLANTQTFTL